MQKGKMYIVISINEIKDIDLCKKLYVNKSDLYFVDNPKIYKFPYNYFTPKQMINRTLKKKKTNLSFAEILELLNINDYLERFDRPWRYQGNNRWICSAALGLAEGKKVFCLPWMPSYILDYQEYRNNQIFNAVKKINGIAILPIERLMSSMYLNDTNVIIKYLDEIM